MKDPVFTRLGREKVNTTKQLQDLIANFRTVPEVFDAQIEQSAEIGGGKYATVYAVGDTAIKLCRAADVGEDLHLQLKFMSRLNKYLQGDKSHSLSTPAYYFAVENSRGDRMLGCQSMIGWQTVNQWLIENKPDTSSGSAAVLSTEIRRRINSAVKPLQLRLGINDLRGDYLDGAHNVLVPIDTLDPTSAPLCLIDQPKNHLLRDESVVGYLTARAVGALAPVS
jgi:hypothetical protein